MLMLALTADHAQLYARQKLSQLNNTQIVNPLAPPFGRAFFIPLEKSLLHRICPGAYSCPKGYASLREHSSLCRVGATKKRDRLAGAVSFSLKGRSSVSRRIMKKKKVIGFVSYLSYCTYINLGL
jgi:hypothetical protein